MKGSDWGSLLCVEIRMHQASANVSQQHFPRAKLFYLFQSNTHLLYSTYKGRQSIKKKIKIRQSYHPEMVLAKDLAIYPLFCNLYTLKMSCKFQFFKVKFTTKIYTLLNTHKYYMVPSTRKGSQALCRAASLHPRSGPQEAVLALRPWVWASLLSACLHQAPCPQGKSCLGGRVTAAR